MAGLRARRDDELLGLFQRLHVETTSERRLRERDAANVEQIVALTFEAWVGRDVQRDVEVARDAATRGRRATPGQAQSLTVVDTGRNLDVDRTRRANPAVATAVATRSGDAAAGGAARDARRRGDDLTEDRATHLTHLTRAAAHVAARGMGAGLAAGSVAAIARDGDAHLDRGGGAERGAREIEVDDHLGVGRARRTCRATRAERVTAEERVEDVAEPEGLATRTAGSTRTARTARPSRFLAEHVEATTALGILQHLVRDR